MMNIEAFFVLALGLLIVGLVLRRGSDIDITVKRSKALEDRLKNELGAKGDGLGQLANNVKDRIPPQMFTDLDSIVKMRNSVVHNKYRDTLADRREYEQLCDRVDDQLNHLKSADSGVFQLLGCLVFFYPGSYGLRQPGEYKLK
ncbi:MAG: hypothetical protein HC875_17955 [Anaerolineales bacterium]|nr:hypothetical protein [Anaerolineales bacterium]